MEPAGLALGAVGLLGLFSLYQEAISVVHSIKNYNSESLRLVSRYNATKLLFERWGKQVGVADSDSLEKNPHLELKDPAIVAAVASLLASICDVFAAVDPTLTRHDQPSATSGGNPGRTKFRSRLKWALADNDKLTLQAQDFDNLVQKLYHLVPPERLQPDEFQKLQETLIQSQRSEALRRVSQWLDATTTENSFDAYCSTRLDTTCGWIDAHPAYQHWLTEQPGKALKVLWVHGPAGFGKSVLCAYIINSLLNNGKPFVCSFFCSGDSDAQRNPSAIPRSWVHQAVNHDDEILDLVLQYLDKCDNTKATHSDIIRLFKDIATHKSELIFVVDGLDECPRTNTARAELHRNRADVLREITKEAAGTGARLLVVSREEGDIKSQIRPHGPQPPGVQFDEVAISRDDVSLDVARFAEHIVTQNLQGNTQQFCQDLASQMAKNSDGMFLLIRLQSQTLRPRKGKSQLQRAISEMPTNLSLVYERHWDDIQRLPPSDRQRAEAILRWVVFARHPLTILELSEIVTVLDADEGDEPQFDDLPNLFDEQFVDEEILGLCGSFLELRDAALDAEFADKTVHLIHFSASEFLLGQQACGPFSNTMLQEYYLAQNCLRYLDCPGTWEWEADEDRFSIHDRPFAVYAVNYWFEHVAECMDSEYDIKSRLLPFFSANNHNWDAWRDHFEDPLSDSSEDEESEEAKSEDNYSEESNLGEGDPEITSSKAEESPGGRTYYAARFGFRDVLQFMHKSGSIDISDTPKYHRDPLQAAACRGHLDVLTFLLEIGANPEAKGVFGSSLLGAVATNEEEAVTVLLRHGASVSATTSTGKSPLCLAAQEGHYFITQQLLNHNSDLAATDDDGQTPLMAAAYCGHIKIVRLLVEKGSLLSARDNAQYTALHWAAYGGDVQIVELLLCNGADISALTDQKSSPLIIAARQGHFDVVRTLLDRGADTTVTDVNGETALIAAARQGYGGIVTLILDYGADPECSKDKDGYNNALIWTACNGHVEAVQRLLDSGAEVNYCTRQGETALSFASRKGHIGIVKTLLDFGASTEIPDTNGYRPSLIAAASGHLEILKLLLDSGASPDAACSEGFTPLIAAAWEGLSEVVKTLLDSGASSEASDSLGWTPLYFAAMSGHLDVIKILLESGVSTEAPSISGRTPLMAAASHGNYEVVKYLLEIGAGFTVADSDGWTPLIDAAIEGHHEIARLLLDYGADKLASGVWRQNHVTPIHVGAERGHVEVVHMLLEAGVDVNISAEDGSTPLHCAVQGNHRDVVELLLHHHASLDQLNLFGRTAFEYANDDTIADFRGRFSECEHYAHPTEDARQQRVRESVSLLAGRVKPLEKKKMTLLDILGRCLLQLNYKLDAAIVFSETTRVDSKSGSLDHNISCDLCDEYVFGERWICTSCRSENLCAACMTKSLADASERPFCSGHKYFCVVEGDGCLPKTNVYTEEFVAWLKELEIRYGLATL